MNAVVYPGHVVAVPSSTRTMRSVMVHALDGQPFINQMNVSKLVSGVHRFTVNEFTVTCGNDDQQHTSTATLNATTSIASQVFTWRCTHGFWVLAYRVRDVERVHDLATRVA
jgi:hypothetical protein